MDAKIMENYVEKVYGYAVNRTYSRDEADELSQEILFTAIRELPKLRDENKFEPWFWGIAANVTRSFRRKLGKQRAMYSYDMPDDLLYEDCYFDENEELYGFLRTKIAMLSAMYRDIIILRYYEGLSTKAVSEKLGIPEGTVKWRLTEARKKLKKECETMEITALKPVKLSLSIGGEGNYNGEDIPYPTAYIDDALSQNILYHCYEKPQTVEELASLCGVPAYYVEDRINNLLSREAVSEVSKGKYRTEFMIFSEKTDKYYEDGKKLLEKAAEPFAEAMKALADRVENLNIYTAEKSKDELTYLYGIMALEALNKKHNPIKSEGYRLRYDGNRWLYFGSTSARRNGEFGKELSGNNFSGGTYCHYSYYLGGFSYRKMMYDLQINVCEDILDRGYTENADSLARLIKNGYIQKREDGFFVTVPKFPLEEYRRFCEMAEETFSEAVKVYANAVSAYAAGYKRLFPSYLEEDVMLMCNYLFLELYGSLCGIMREKGLLAKPGENWVCDVMVQNKME